MVGLWCYNQSGVTELLIMRVCKKQKMFLPHPQVKVSIVGSLRDREVACLALDRQGANFEFCVWRTVSSQSSHHPQEVLLAQFSLYVHKGGLKPDSFHLIMRDPHYGGMCFKSVKTLVALHSRNVELLGLYPIHSDLLPNDHTNLSCNLHLLLN